MIGLSTKNNLNKENNVKSQDDKGSVTTVKVKKSKQNSPTH